MKPPTGLLLLILFVLNTAFSFMMFERFNSNVIIPYIVLIGLGTWVYGRFSGLVIMLLSLIPCYLVYQLNADQYTYYYDRLTGISIMLITVAVISHLKTNMEGIREFNQELEKMVSARDQELSWLSDELLQYAEKRRTETGQKLHDGLGQQLTGIQLLCSSLEHHLNSNNGPEKKLVASLTRKSSHIHNQIRRIARSLFPVRIAHVGLFSALNEMMACLSEIYGKPIFVKELGELHGIPENISLQIYRICQESCTLLLEHSGAEMIRVSLNASSTHYKMAIEHNGNFGGEADHNLFNLIQYRIAVNC